MKKYLITLLLALLAFSSVFAGELFGDDKNLSLNGDLSFLLYSNHRALDDVQISNNENSHIYNVCAMGIKLEAQYDVDTLPIDLYAGASFGFPTRYRITSSENDIFKKAAKNQNRKEHSKAKTAWTMTKISAGILADINLGLDDFFLKLGGGINLNSFITKNTGYDAAITFSDTYSFKSFGLEAKAELKYFIKENLYARFSLETGFSFLGSYSRLIKSGNDLMGTKIPTQFVTGFNFNPAVGICYSL